MRSIGCVHRLLSGQVVNVADIFREVSGRGGPVFGSADVVDKFRECIGGQQGESLRYPVSIVYVQGVVTRTSCRILVFVDVAEFRMRPKQLSLRNRRLIKAASTRSNLAEEWVWNLRQQSIAHRKVLGIQLIQIEAARVHVHAMIANIGDIDHVVGRRRILETVGPLLVIIRLTCT